MPNTFTTGSMPEGSSPGDAISVRIPYNAAPEEHADIRRKLATDGSWGRSPAMWTRFSSTPPCIRPGPLPDAQQSLGMGLFFYPRGGIGQGGGIPFARVGCLWLAGHACVRIDRRAGRGRQCCHRVFWRGYRACVI